MFLLSPKRVSFVIFVRPERLKQEALGAFHLLAICVDKFKHVLD